MALIVVLVVLLIPILAAVAVIGVAGGPVRRRRLARFAQRQGLVISAANGAQVIRYLAVTRRWRTTGVAAGIAVPIAISEIEARLRGGTFGLNFSTMFAGWFVGAIIAEFRLSAAPVGAHRVASLRPRTPRRYLGPLPWIALGLSLAVVWILTGVLLVVRDDRLVHLVPALIATVTVIVVRVVARRVVDRPQPHQPIDQLAADDAIRSRSVHVLCGSGLAVTLLSLATIFLDMVASTGSADRVLVGIGILMTLAAPVIGYCVATARFRVADESGAAATESVVVGA
jgi:hypothetical protein